MRSSMLFSLLPIAAIGASVSGTLTVDTSKPGVSVCPTLYGIFFEEINRAGEGGIYAEMLQNRSFEDNKNFPSGWLAHSADVSIDQDRPLTQANPSSLHLVTREGGELINAGFIGGHQSRAMHDSWANWMESADGLLPQIAVKKGAAYDLSFSARTAGAPVTLKLSLETADGKTLASGEAAAAGADWKKCAVTFTPSDSCATARFVLRTAKPGECWLDGFSLFPKETWKNRPNGFRPDLMEMLAAMKPAFVRFPGGCFVEGNMPENRAQWKHSIGPLEERIGQYCTWGYRISNGFGYHEFLQMCEDLGAEPLYVINCGMSHHDKPGLYAFPMEQMGTFVQDAIDAIEYANGPADSKWGALRAKAGHPEPFHLKYMEIGNEEGGPDYPPRFEMMTKAILAKYPYMRLIANEPTKGVKDDIVDPHMYSDVDAFCRDAHRFDNYNRQDPQIYFGEYAVTRGSGKGNLIAAVGEAAFMTGLERNSDIVIMSSYAPLFCRYGWRGWNPNAINFDQSRVYGTPSYWAQCMFSQNRADRVLPSEISFSAPPAAKPITGKIGIGSWSTQCEFKDIKVTKGGQTLFAADFTKGLGGWAKGGREGQWAAVDGVARQTSDETAVRFFAGDTSWSDYTLSLKARKLRGAEGFIIFFGMPDNHQLLSWNIGGWGNTSSAIEGGGFQTDHVPGKIETDKWYDIRIELNGGNVKCFLDDKLIHDQTRPPAKNYAFVSGLDDKTGETVIKFANATDLPMDLTVSLGGKSGALSGKAITMAGAPDDENTLDEPRRVAPVEKPVSFGGPKFPYTFPACSVTVLRLK